MDSYPEYGYTYPSNVGIPYPYPPAVMDTVSVSTRRLGYIVDARIQEEDRGCKQRAVKRKPERLRKKKHKQRGRKGEEERNDLRWRET